MKTILIVEDNQELRENLCEVLEGEGFDCLPAPSGELALKIAHEKSFEAALIDLVLPAMSGIEFLSQVRLIRPKAKFIIMTAFATVENAVEAMKQGASDYLIKPFSAADLVITLRDGGESDCCSGIDEDTLYYTLSNEIRRNIIEILSENQSMKFMDLARALGFDDHTKMYFHLKILRKARFIEQTESDYFLTETGKKLLGCLASIQRKFFN